MKSSVLWRRGSVFVMGMVMLLVSPIAHGLELDPAERARSLILEMRLQEAERVLEGSGSDTRVVLVRGRMLLYSTRYEEAQGVLERSDVLATEEGAHLAQVARGSARAVAGAFVVHDLYRDVVVRLQDDRDQPLVPFIAEVVHASRVVMRQELGVDLPSPMRIELVRDHFSLAAMTGLPEDAARTTGTVAVANWGRVTMVTPRSMDSAYRWMDTLAHELAHVALGLGTRDRAPLWLQEGVAKYFEKRWREWDSYDESPSADAVAWAGFDMGLGRDFEGIGRSVALLPSPVEATVVYAQVESFLGFLVRALGDRLLSEMVPRLREAWDGDGVSEVLESISGQDLVAWQAVWRDWLESVPREGASEVLLGAQAPDPVAMRDVRLGRLLLERGRGKAVMRLLESARGYLPADLHVRYLLAKSYLLEGSEERAWSEVAVADPPMTPHAEAFSLRGRLLKNRGSGGDVEGEADAALFRGLSMNPWSTEVACEGLDEPVLPSSPANSWLCRAARLHPRR